MFLVFLSYSETKTEHLPQHPFTVTRDFSGKSPVIFAPPYMKNPNPFPIGRAFGFLFISKALHNSKIDAPFKAPQLDEHRKNGFNPVFKSFFLWYERT
jgi:hypothetical protein